MRERTSKSREGEQNAKQKDEVYDELKSESNTLREEDVEINSFVIEVPAEKICVDEASTVGAAAVGVDADLSKRDNVKSVVVGVNFVDNVNFLETDDYVAKESVKDVAIGDNLSLMPSRGIT